jgi:hypothetical protein
MPANYSAWTARQTLDRDTSQLQTSQHQGVSKLNFEGLPSATSSPDNTRGRLDTYCNLNPQLSLTERGNASLLQLCVAHECAIELLTTHESRIPRICNTGKPMGLTSVTLSAGPVTMTTRKHPRNTLLLVTLALIEVCVIVAIILAAEGLLNSVTSTRSRRRYMLPARLLAGRVRSASDLTKGARAGQFRSRHVRRATYSWVTAYSPKPYRGRPSPQRAAKYQQWRLHKLSKHIRLCRSRDVLICPLPPVWLAAPTRVAPTELPTAEATATATGAPQETCDSKGWQHWHCAGRSHFSKRRQRHAD